MEGSTTNNNATVATKCWICSTHHTHRESSLIIDQNWSFKTVAGLMKVLEIQTLPECTTFLEQRDLSTTFCSNCAPLMVKRIALAKKQVELGEKEAKLEKKLMRKRKSGLELEGELRQEGSLVIKIKVPPVPETDGAPDEEVMMEIPHFGSRSHISDNLISETSGNPGVVDVHDTDTHASSVDDTIEENNELEEVDNNPSGGRDIDDNEAGRDENQESDDIILRQEDSYGEEESNVDGDNLNHSHDIGGIMEEEGNAQMEEHDDDEDMEERNEEENNLRQHEEDYENFDQLSQYSSVPSSVWNDHDDDEYLPPTTSRSRSSYFADGLYADLPPIKIYPCPCIVCNVFYPNPPSLSAHYKNEHANGPWICIDCNKGLKSRIGLYQHRRLSHNFLSATFPVPQPFEDVKPLLVPDPLIPQVNPPGQPTPTASSSRQAAAEDMTRMRTRNEDKFPFPCSHCPRKYPNAQDLKLHEEKDHNRQWGFQPENSVEGRPFRRPHRK